MAFVEVDLGMVFSLCIIKCVLLIRHDVARQVTRDREVWSFIKHQKTKHLINFAVKFVYAEDAFLGKNCAG